MCCFAAQVNTDAQWVQQGVEFCLCQSHDSPESIVMAVRVSISVRE
jgi:hypothetical protein